MNSIFKYKDNIYFFHLWKLKFQLNICFDSFQQKCNKLELNLDWVDLSANPISIQMSMILMDLNFHYIDQKYFLKFELSTVYHNRNLIQVVLFLYNLIFYFWANRYEIFSLLVKVRIPNLYSLFFLLILREQMELEFQLNSSI